MKHVLHISNRTLTMLCGTADTPGELRRYLNAKPEAHHGREYTACQACLDREPMMLLASTNLDGSGANSCWHNCGKQGTHLASYDHRWTCEDCIY